MLLSRSLLLKISFVGIMLTVMPNVANAGRGFSRGPSGACYVDNARSDGTKIDRFWYCGQQEPGCNGVSEWKRDDAKMFMHGGDFTWTQNGGQGKYYCCDGTTTKAGIWVHADDWETSEEVTEVLSDGSKCKWVRKKNACGDYTNESDKCTSATYDCKEGYIERNGKCTKICESGFAYESDTSDTCIRCDDEPWKGIVNGVCKICDNSQFLFSERDRDCIPKANKMLVSTLAHEECWLCSSPARLLECLKSVTNGGKATDIEGCRLHD